jgi:hypothetical protein
MYLVYNFVTFLFHISNMTSTIHKNIDLFLWGNFLSFSSQFYKVTMFKSTNATGEGKMQV